MVRFLTVVCTLAASIWVVQFGPSLAIDANELKPIHAWLSGLRPPAQATPLPAPLPVQAPEMSPETPVPDVQVQRETGAAAPEPESGGSVSIPYFAGKNPQPSANGARLLGDRFGGDSPAAPAGSRQQLDVPRIPLPAPPVPTLAPTALPRRPAPARAPPPSLVRTGKGVQTLLLLGSDRRPGDSTWRTDVIMVVVIDNPAKTAKIISIPRDLYIEFPPEADPNKINTFDYWGEQLRPGGGPELLSQIIYQHLGIPIELFARVQFSGFEDIVNALGGIEVQVPCPVYDFKPEEDIYLSLQPGYYQMDGATALAYVRTREQGGDLARVQRQQDVLLALRNQFKVRNLAPQIPSLYKTLKNAVDTNIGFIDAVNLARFGYDLQFENIDMLTLGPPDHMETGWALGMQVWLPDWERIRQDVQIMIDSPIAMDVTGASAAVQPSASGSTRCQ